MMYWALLMLATTIGLVLYLRIAPSLNFIDKPNARSLHSAPTVVGAGAVPILLLVGVIYVLSGLPNASGIALVTISLVAIGLWDDRIGAPAGIRLVCYIAAGFALSGFVPLFEQSGMWTTLIIGFAVAWCINLVNFMDGIDGIVTIHAVCVSVGLGLTGEFHPSSVDTEALVLLCSALVACFAPLLFYNWPPARLFMGDAGAAPLGFLLALLGLLASRSHASLGWAWLILMMPVLVDTGLTLFLRLMARKAPHVAHCDHAYQRLTVTAGSALPVTLGLLALHLTWQFPLAVAAVNTAVIPSLLVFLSSIPSLILVVYVHRKA